MTTPTTENTIDTTTLEFDDIFFNRVDRKIKIIQPKMVQEGTYINQSVQFEIDNFKSVHVLKLGLGSVGSHAVYDLNKMGISSFTMFEPDITKPHNSASSIYDYRRTQDLNNIGNSRDMMVRYHRLSIPMFSYVNKSPFKADQMTEILNRHDIQTNIEIIKARFGSTVQQSVNEFIGTINSFGGRNIYTTKGRLKDDYSFDFNIEETTINRTNLDKYTDPSICIMSTDTIQARFQSVVELMKKQKSKKYFPIIDSAVANSLQGEVFCIDLFNSEQMLNWTNSMVKEKYEDWDTAFKDMKSKEIYNHTLQLDDVQVCGDKMSIISASQSSIIVTALVRGLFFESSKPNFDNVQAHTNWSYLNGYMKPYLTSQQDINY